MKFNDMLIQEMQSAVLCWLATTSAEGSPNVSPKEIFAPHGMDAVAIADIASPISVANIRAVPRACVSFIDIFRQRGFKIEGPARVIGREEPAFASSAARVLEKAGPDFPVRNLILVEAARISRIVAPSYRIFPERSEEQRMAEAYRTYGVSPMQQEGATDGDEKERKGTDFVLRP